MSFIAQSTTTNTPSHFKELQLHCVPRSSTSYYYKNTLQLLTIHTPPLVANNTDSVVTAYSLKVSVNNIAQCKDPTVIGTFAIILCAMITVSSLELQLALLKPLSNFFTPILFYSHAFQFVYNLIGIPLWPFELLVFSTSLQWFMYWLIMVHLTTVRTTLGMKNS